MDLQEALARAESWRNNPGIRPEPKIAREVVIALATNASRYLYLRSQPESCEPDHIDVVLWSPADESGNDGTGIRGDALDAEIDKRMAATAA